MTKVDSLKKPPPSIVLGTTQSFDHLKDTNISTSTSRDHSSSFIISRKIINYPSLSTIIFTLLTICILSVNNYFSYHAPSAIAQEFETAYHLSTQQFGCLFTIYSLPNIILVFFSGLVIDRYVFTYVSI